MFTKEENVLKRFTALLLSLLLCISAIPTFATVDSYYDGNKIPLSDAVTFYPAIELLKTLGADIEMDGNDFTAVLENTIISYDSYYEELYIGDDYYYEGDAFQVLNDTLYFPLSILKEIAPIDYTEKSELRIISPKAAAEQKAKDEKKFNTMYPKLSKALIDLPNTNFEQNMTLKMKVEDITTSDKNMQEEFESMDEAPQIKLTTFMARDVKNDAYSYKLNLETNEYGSIDTEVQEIIILKDAVFSKDGASWYQESMEDFEDIKLDIDIMPFFFNNINNIEKERISGGIAYTIKLEEAPISVLLDALGDQYADAMEIDSIDDDYNAVFKDLEWRIVVSHKSQLLENQLSGTLSMYNSWSDSTMFLSIDLDAAYDMTKDIVIESPIEDYKPQTPIDLSKLKINLNDKSYKTALDLKEVEKTLFIKATDLDKIINVTTTEGDYTLKVSTDDISLEFEDYSDEIIVGDTQFLSSADIFIENEAYYLPLKSVTEFLGGLCMIDREKNTLSIYTPDYLKSTYFNKNTSQTDKLAQAINQLNTSTFRTDRGITFKVDNYVNYAGDRYDDYDLSYMNNTVEEVELVDPINKYLNSSRKIKVLGDYEKSYDMKLVSYEDSLYYTFIHDDESPHWYKDENIAYERLVHDEMIKFEKVRPLLNAVASDTNSFTYKTRDQDLSQEEKISLARMVYDGFVMDHLYTFPIDSIELKEFEITYTMKTNGQIGTQNESYLFKFDDGERTFDITLVNEIKYSAFNQPVEISIPDTSEE
jgi:hypothetical protein